MPKRKLIEFTIPTDPELSVIDGRNGCFRIQKLYVWESHDHHHVYIDGIGRRGIAIKGGLRVTIECFASACRQFLDEYEKRFPQEKLCAPHGDACCDICSPEGEKL